MTGSACSPSRHRHPRLFFDLTELSRLRAQRYTGHHARIWRNVAASADWCLERPLRTAWIAPVTPDPIHANLYDRFYAMMHDMAVMRDGARVWTLACCRVWRREADGDAEYRKAYAVMRLLKGVAVAYDLLYPELSEDERAGITAMLTQVGDVYYRWYLDHPSMGTVQGQGAHHASVEAASFGLLSLALLGDVPQAADWLALMVRKHRESILPEALADDGAQVQGATFWASTMQYRLAFMDALRRVTGEELFTPFARHMDARLALASVAGRKTGGHDQDNETVVLEPSYGQLNYYSPVLLGLARFYRNPLHQHLALWDATVGAVQQSRYITDNGEWLLFDWGGYAYAWYDPTVSEHIDPAAPLSFSFPSVNEAYLRASYALGGIVVGVRRNTVIVHAGGRPVYADHHVGDQPPAEVADMVVQDDGDLAKVTCSGVADSGFVRQTLVLSRPQTLTFSRDTNATQHWWCYGTPARDGNLLRWEDGTSLEVTRGQIIAYDPAGYQDEKVVGLGLLRLRDPLPMTYPLVTAEPADGQVVIVVRGSL